MRQRWVPHIWLLGGTFAVAPALGCSSPPGGAAEVDQLVCQEGSTCASVVCPPDPPAVGTACGGVGRCRFSDPGPCESIFEMYCEHGVWVHGGYVVHVDCWPDPDPPESACPPMAPDAGSTCDLTVPCPYPAPGCAELGLERTYTCELGQWTHDGVLCDPPPVCPNDPPAAEYACTDEALECRYPAPGCADVALVRTHTCTGGVWTHDGVQCGSP